MQVEDIKTTPTTEVPKPDMKSKIWNLETIKWIISIIVQGIPIVMGFFNDFYEKHPFVIGGFAYGELLLIIVFLHRILCEDAIRGHRDIYITQKDLYQPAMNAMAENNVYKIKKNNK
jgi:hypothetical protein